MGYRVVFALDSNVDAVDGVFDSEQEAAEALYDMVYTEVVQDPDINTLNDQEFDSEVELRCSYYGIEECNEDGSTQ